MEALQNIFQAEIVQRIGWTLVHFVWQAAAIAVVLAIILRLMRNSSASLRYIVVCIALLLIVVMPVITIGMVDVDIEVVEAVVQPVVFQPAVDVEPVVVVELPLVEPVPVEAGPLPSVPLQDRFIAAVEPVLPYAVVGWLFGVLGLSLWHLGGWRQLQRLRRQMVKDVAPALTVKLSQLSKSLGISTAVGLVESALVQVPTVVGHLKPVILLPASALTGLSAEQIEAILAHELAHIKRCDYLVNMLQTVVEILGFYHPAVWWVSHKIRVERENCCDDMAVDLCSDKLCYAKALTTMEEIRAKQPALAVAASGGNLLGRIRRLLGKDSANENKISWLPSVVVMLLVCSMLIPICLATSRGTASSKSPSFIIRGTVTDAQTGEPVANVKVGDDQKYNNGKQAAVTDSKGKYEYKTWYEEHNIKAEAKGYETGHKGLRTKFIGSEKETVIDFKLTPDKKVSDPFNSKEELFPLDKVKIRMGVEEFKAIYPDARSGLIPPDDPGRVPRDPTSDLLYQKIENNRFWNSAIILVESNKISSCLYVRVPDWELSKENVPDIYRQLIGRFGKESERKVATSDIAEEKKTPVYLWDVDGLIYTLSHTPFEEYQKGEMFSCALKVIRKGDLSKHFMGLSDYDEKDRELFKDLQGVKVEKRPAPIGRRVKKELSPDILKKRNKLLADAQTEIQKGFIKLSKRFSNLKKAYEWQQETTKVPAPGEIRMLLVYPRRGKPFEDNYVVSVQVYPSGFIPLIGAPTTASYLLPTYPNLLLDGDTIVKAGNPELNAALKKLVYDALEPLMQLETSLAKQKPTVSVGGTDIRDKKIVPGLRIGEYTFGMSKDDVLESLGKPRMIFYGDEKYTLDNLPEKYFMVFDNISFYIADGSVKGITAVSPYYKFANGLGVGDSQEKIKQAFGDNFHLKETEWKDFLTYENQGLSFEINKQDRTVMEINIEPVAGASGWGDAVEGLAVRLCPSKQVITKKQKAELQLDMRNDRSKMFTASFYYDNVWLQVDGKWYYPNVSLGIIPAIEIKPGATAEPFRKFILRSGKNSQWNGGWSGDAPPDMGALSWLPAAKPLVLNDGSHAVRATFILPGKTKFVYVTSNPVEIEILPPGEKPAEPVKLEIDLPATSTINKYGHIVDKIDYPFVDDLEVIGGWKSVDFIEDIDQFNPDKKNWKGDLFLKELFFMDGGKTNWAISWTKGLLLHSGDKTASQYTIKDIDGSKYMFMEWKSGDYKIRHAKPSYYVLKKDNDMVYVESRTKDKIDYPFVSDPDVIGGWKSVDFVNKIQDFKAGEKQWKGGGLFLNEMLFGKDGELMCKNNKLPNGYRQIWTRGLVINTNEETASRYTIKEIDDSIYMFYEWKSGDYTFRGMKPKYYVLKKDAAVSLNLHGQQVGHYTVVSGDSLASIAKKFYGAKDGCEQVYIDVLYAANKETLNSPEDIRVGQKLIIPSLVPQGPQVVIEARFITVADGFIEAIGWESPRINAKPGILNDMQLEFIIKATEGHRLAKTLTAPKVFVRDNEKASIAIMTEKPYISGYTEVESAPDKPEAKVVYFDSGIKTDLTPHITPDGKNVRLEFKFNHSDMNIGAELLYKGKHPYHKPEKNVTEIVSEVLIPDGKTFLCEPQQITRYDADGKAVKKKLLILLKPTIILSPDKPVKSSVAMKLPGGMGGGFIGGPGGMMMMPDMMGQEAVKDGPQVSIETRYISVDEKFLEELGVDLFECNANHVMLDDLSARFILKAVTEKPEATTLSAPKITVVDNEKGIISVTKETAYVTGYTEVESDPKHPKAVTKEIVSGINTDITPHITEDGRSIKLEIDSTFSSVSGGKKYRYKKRHTYYKPDINVDAVAIAATINDGGTLLIDGGFAKSFNVKNRPVNKRILIMVKPTIIKAPARPAQSSAAVRLKPDGAVERASERKKQLLIDMHHVSVTEDLLKELGVVVTRLEDGGVRIDREGDSDSSCSLFSDEEIDVIFKAAEQGDEARMLSKPRFLLMDGEIGKINSVEEVHFVTGYTESEKKKMSPEPKIETFKKGYDVEVLPKISDDGKNIKLGLKTNIYDASKGETVGLYKDKYPYSLPEIMHTSIESEAVIPDQKTVVLGGVSFKPGETDDISGKWYRIILVKPRILRPGEPN